MCSGKSQVATLSLLSHVSIPGSVTGLWLEYDDWSGGAGLCNWERYQNHIIIGKEERSPQNKADSAYQKKDVTGIWADENNMSTVLLYFSLSLC